MSEKFKVFISKFKQHFQKKNFLMIMAVVLFIAVSVSIPVHQAHAGWGADIFADIINSIVAGISWLMTPFRVILWFILIVVLNTLLNISIIFVNMGAWFIDAALDPRLYVGDPATGTPGVLTSSTITTGWTTVRDMCNTFYVFFLLVIAFGTILRSSTFNAKNLLPKLIISLFLINFSAVIAKLVIDFGQVFMYGIMSWMGTFGDGGGSLTSIVDNFNEKININLSDITLSKVMLIASALAYSVILALVYIMLALFLMVRLVAFVFLIILSPIAFLSITMPSLGKYTSEWWGELVKYSLFGPIFMFFVYLSATMANEMVIDYKPVVSSGSGFDEIKDVIVTIFPSIIPLMMLMYVIPITQRLGVSGANKIIGGRLGLGNIVMGGYAGAKKTFGVGKAVVGTPANALHAYGMGRGGAYKDRMDKISATLKTMPIVGRMVIVREARKTEKHEEDVTKHEKILDKLTLPDKKVYINSFDKSLDAGAMKKKADATQAMFNLLAKDAGKGLTDGRLQKIYEKEVRDKNGKAVMRDKMIMNKDGNMEKAKDRSGNVIKEVAKVFDRKKFESDLNRVRAYGHDTETFETYRPDFVKGTDEEDTRKKKVERVEKIVHDGNEKRIKLAALEDPVVDNTLLRLIKKKKYDNLINNKSQEEKDELVESQESEIVDSLSKGISATSSEIEKLQKSIALLAGAEKMKEKMKEVKIDANGEIEYFGNVKIDLVNDVMKKMTKDQFLDLNTEFLEEFGHMVSENNITHLNKFGETEQLEAIKKALKDAGKGAISKPSSLDSKTITARLKSIEKKIS